MTSKIKKLLEATNSHPFLFVGSGFTHRYLGTDDWKGLINRFACEAKPEVEFAYEWYRNEVAPSGKATEQDLPSITEYVEKDYARRFLSDDSFRALRERHEARIRDGVSPLKIGVADLLLSLNSKFATPSHVEEISAIGHARKNVAGIITTNFDCFLEHIFPEHIPYIGQNQLLFSQIYGVGEIYKIHGCVTEPSSLVLTQKDYDAYRSRNAYLSAKLMTIFLEHPIIFLGYSLSDANIRMIFSDIAKCLNDDQLSKLSERLIFVQRAKEGRPEGIRTNRDTFDSGIIESTSVVLSDFSQLFKAIAGLKSTYSPKILRKLKKDVYELALSTSPKERIRVVGIDEATEMENVEFVIGIGVSKQLSGQGYAGLEVFDLISDTIHGVEDALDAQQVVEHVLPKLGRQTSYNLPVFKYTSQMEDGNLPVSVAKYVNDVKAKGIDYWITSSMRKSRNGKPKLESLSNLMEGCDCGTVKGLQQVLQEMAFIPEEKIDLEEFRKLLIQVWETHDPIRNKTEQTLTTNFRKAVRIYDWLKYGHKKTPKAPKGEEAH
jgi:hypothetical protein